MDDRKKRAGMTTGRRSAAAVRAWLEGGGRRKVEQALQHAVRQTQERNKARALDPDFLDRRVTF
jgi:hypothetical protein